MAGVFHVREYGWLASNWVNTNSCGVWFSLASPLLVAGFGSGYPFALGGGLLIIVALFGALAKY